MDHLNGQPYRGNITARERFSYIIIIDQKKSTAGYRSGKSRRKSLDSGSKRPFFVGSVGGGLLKFLLFFRKEILCCKIFSIITSTVYT